MFGYTRFAYHKARKREKDNAIDYLKVLEIVIREKAILKNSGAKKMYHIIKPEIKGLGIKIGRDKFLDLLRDNGFLIKKKKYKKPKTDSNHHFKSYQNLIKDLNVSRPNQVWVSDITYIRVNNNWAYLTLVTDLFSRKIVGFAFSKTMRTQDTTLPATNMALKLKNNSEKTILHSDRGRQYCMPLFTNKLKKKIKFSNTKNGDPYENAVAERLNGILKYEFDLNDNFKNFKLAKNEIKKAVSLYNSKRPHWSLDLKTPDQVFFDYTKTLSLI